MPTDKGGAETSGANQEALAICEKLLDARREHCFELIRKLISTARSGVELAAMTAVASADAETDAAIYRLVRRLGGGYP